MSAPAWKIRRFNRRLIVAAVSLFGLGTTLAHALALATPSAAPGARTAAPFHAFDALMGLAYLVAGWGVGMERRWAQGWAWGLAAAHALAAALLAALMLGGAAVPVSAVAVALGREGFWVLIGLYLRRAR